MDRQVTIYTTPTCGYCREAKSFLTELGVQYKEIDVSADQEAAVDIVRRTNQYSVPVIDVGGTLVIGFDRSRLEKLLHIA
ncbi:MAG: glutaredoxin family protein [Chloroflexi bacterium]|nr:glutaredoxin family protein [Chloroflexota bacterium]